MKKEFRRVRNMFGDPIVARMVANGEGYAMVRRKGCAPFIITENEWRAGEVVGGPDA